MSFSKIIIKLIIAGSIAIALIMISINDTASNQIKEINIENYIEVPTEVTIAKPEPKIISQKINESKPELRETVDYLNSNAKLVTAKGFGSHYADKFHGRKTASGDIFDMNGYSAAHKKLPFGTIIKVENVRNDKVVLVKVNDRGPYAHDRIIDLSLQAAKEIDDLGISKLKINYIKPKIKNDNSYIGFSEDKEFVEIEGDKIEFLGEFEDFTDAYKYYRKQKQKRKINDVFIFVNSNEYPNNFSYQIGILNSETLFSLNN